MYEHLKTEVIVNGPDLKFISSVLRLCLNLRIKKAYRNTGLRGLLAICSSESSEGSFGGASVKHNGQFVDTRTRRTLKVRLTYDSWAIE